MSSIKDYIVVQLKEMGFDETKIEKAIKETKGETLEQVMEWIITHENDAAVEQISAANDVNKDGNDDDDIIELPKEETGEDGEQIAKKEKTDEEKEQERRKYEELIKQRRVEREEKERKEQIEKEKFRRKTGSEMIRVREEIAQKEKIRLAEELRKEKMEKEAHKRAILEQIRLDRETMKNKNLLNDSPLQQLQQQTPQPQQQQQQSTSQPASVNIDAKSKCRIAVRLPNGQNLQQEFSVQETLAAVRLYIQLNRNDNSTANDFNLLLPPNRLFTNEDMEKTLAELGLYPSARLTLSDRK